MNILGRRHLKFLRLLLVLGIPILSSFAALKILIFSWEVASSQGWTQTDWNWDSKAVTKLLTFHEDTDRYSGIFLGSSLTHYQIIPAIIESELQEKPGAKVFNFGLPQGSFGEAVLILKSILNTNPKSLEWIVLDTELLTQLSQEEQRYTEKAFSWHNFEETFFAVKYSFLRELPLKVKIQDASLHVFQFLQHITSLRTLSLNVRHYKTVPDSGFVSFDNASFDTEVENSIKFLMRLFFHKRSWSLAPRSDIMPNPTDVSYRVFMLNRIIGLAREFNPKIKIIFYSPPSGRYNWSKSEAFLSEFGSYARVEMNSVLDYPELFDFNVRFDPTHLKYEGAVRLSHLLGKRLGKVLDKPAVTEQQTDRF